MAHCQYLDPLRHSLGAGDIDVLILAVLARVPVWCRRSVSAELVSSKSRRLSEKDLRSWAWQRLRPTGKPYHSAEDLPPATSSNVLAVNILTLSHLTSPHLPPAIGVRAVSLRQAFFVRISCYRVATTDLTRCDAPEWSDCYLLALLTRPQAYCTCSHLRKQLSLTCGAL